MLEEREPECCGFFPDTSKQLENILLQRTKVLFVLASFEIGLGSPQNPPHIHVSVAAEHASLLVISFSHLTVQSETY